MDAERRAVLESLYHAVLAKEPSERLAYLAAACAGDPALQREIESLLTYTNVKLRGPALPSEEAHPSDEIAGTAVTSTLTSALDVVFSVGAVIDGKYRIDQQLGHGGMGEVWLAEQKHPVRRRVALKLIKAGMDTREVVARFESERQALALMDHPAIAKVFDAGSTLQARPYFAMEYVPGISITAYCDKHRLTIRERLELFIHVCEGVQHAHQRAIIHRDLKPSNILVIEVDDKPVPKIIDFGVAKAVSQPLIEATHFTRVGSVIGTLEYMSPEQGDSGGQAIDTRTDVYSLGVILYELLLGTLPMVLRNLAFDEALLKLRQNDVPRPSIRICTLGESSTTVAQNRRTEPNTLARQLRGDLDSITLKALEKDRSMRYGAPSELAADIARYLRNEPVAARHAGVGYRARKYLRRHRIGVSVAAGLLLLLASFAITQSLQLRRITRERDRADRITDFMTSMFKVSNPSEARGNKVTAREILDKGSNDIGSGLANDPDLQAQMMHVMGSVYWNLGIYSRAHSLLIPAIEIRRRILGPQHPDTLASMQDLAKVLAGEGRATEAEKLSREVLDIRRRVLGTEHPDTLKSLNTLARIAHDQGHDAEAEKIFRQLRETYGRLLGPDHPDTLRSADNLGLVLDQEGHYAEADALHTHVLEVNRRLLGPDHPETVRTMDLLANTLDNEGHYAQSEKLEREVIDIRRRVLGVEHPDTLISMMNLGLTLTHLGQNAEAEKLLRQVLEFQRRVLGPEHQDTLHSMSNITNALVNEHHYAEAERLVREVLNIRRRVLGPEHPETASSIYSLACIAALTNQRVKAIALLREALDHGLDEPTALGIEQEPDFNSLHAESQFREVVAYARRRPAQSIKSK